MEAAALVLLASVVGVSYGWQPMPDGSPRYEYIVHVTPEMADSLADGQAIPLVSEPPADIRPIARVRISVDRRSAPRRQLVTLLKPTLAAKPASDEPILLAQFSQPPAAGQGSPANAFSIPDNRYPAPSAPAAAETTWNGVAPAGNATVVGGSGNNSWNGGGAEDARPVAPSNVSVPGTAYDAYGRAVPQSATPAAAAPTAGQLFGDAQAYGARQLDQIGSQVQGAARDVGNNLRTGVDQIDSGVRNAAESAGQRARNLVDELRQPLGASGNASASGAPSGAAAWNGGAPPANGTAAPSPVDRGGTWNGSATTPGTTISINQGSGQASGAAAEARWNGGEDSAPVTTGTSPAARGGDRWPAVTQAPAPFEPQRTNPNVTLGDGPQFPGFGTVGAGSQGAPASASATTPNVGVPSLAKSMLNEPATRPLDGPTTGAAAPAVPFPGAEQVRDAAQASNQAAINAAAAIAQGMKSGVQGAAPNAAAANGGGSAVAALMAWVLLTGSAAGNLYLFWSYVDVRNKYRLLIRKTARAVGGRLSAA